MYLGGLYMDETSNEMTEVNVGDIVTGTVVKIEEKQVLVEIGYKTEGILPISELSSLHVEKTSDVVNDGEEITLKVKKVTDDEVILSKKAVDADKHWEDLQVKFENEEIFETEISSFSNLTCKSSQCLSASTAFLDRMTYKLN